MANDVSISNLQLSSLPSSIRELISLSLNSEKVIHSDGPDKLPRDWRGLAFKVGLSSTYETYIRQQCEDKTAKVLEIWQQKHRSAIVGELLVYLECIDRYDVAEDVFNKLVQAVSSGEPSANSQNRVAIPRVLVSEPQTGLITNDDRPGYAQIYDAMVLYAAEDQEFAKHMMERITVAGYTLCTVDDLQVGHSSQYAPVSRLISERCRRVILVLSPDFLHSPAMRFYANYATADSIETERRVILPLMLRYCTPPPPLHLYTSLPFRNDNNFWERLLHSLELSRMSTAVPQIKITNAIQQRAAQPSGKILNDYMDAHLFHPRPDFSASLPRLNSVHLSPLSSTQESQSLSNVSQISADSQPKKKKKSYFSKFLNTFKGKKSKNSSLSLVA